MSLRVSYISLPPNSNPIKRVLVSLLSNTAFPSPTSTLHQTYKETQKSMQSLWVSTATYIHLK